MTEKRLQKEHMEEKAWSGILRALELSTDTRTWNWGRAL